MTDQQTTEQADQEIIDAFHLLWYERRQRQTWRNTTWMGAELQQCPLDLWIYQELIHKARPEVFVEVGIKRGGLTRYIADLFGLIHGRDKRHGRVVGVDISVAAAREAVGRHKRITLVEGSSVDEHVFEQVRKECGGRPAMVLLDSDHAEAHVRAELELYHTLIGAGGYLIVNDTNIGGHPALDWKESSPWDAVHDFVSVHPEFEIDRECEKHMLTQCPDGFLHRVA
jgi:cephalosporin hydroxylase